MKRLLKICIIIFLQSLFLNYSLAAQDTLLTIENAVKYAIANNYEVIISKNNIEIGKINNNWANAGAVPVISATANAIGGVTNLQEKLSDGTITNKNGSTSSNLNAGVAVSWNIFDGLKMFASKRRLEELERNGEYAFKKNLNQTVYDVVSSYFNVVTINEQIKSTLEQISLYRDRYNLAQRRFEIGTGAKYEVLAAQVDLNEQNSLLLILQNSLAVAKTSLNNLMGKIPDTSYRVTDTIIVNGVMPIAEAQIKIEKQNPDILLANSDLAVLFETKKVINADRLPVVSLHGYYNFAKTTNSAGFNLFTQTYGPMGSVGVAVPIFNGGLVKKHVAVTDIQIKNQTIAIEETKNTLRTILTNAYINYNNSIKLVELEKSNLVLAEENIYIANERYKKLNITSVELRQIQISYSDAKNRLFNALYQAKLAEAQVAVITGDILNLLF